MDNLLKVENIKLESYSHLKEISFDVNKSEIIGIFCKIDNGQEQIIDSICGIKKVKEGKISVEEGKEFLSTYRSGLYGYTYLE